MSGARADKGTDAMPIKATADTEVRTLITALGDEDAARREGAIARLTILGTRAIGRLESAYASTPDRRTRLAILRVLETSGDERALAVARRAMAEGGDVAVAGIAVLRELVHTGARATHTEALETLLALSIDRDVERRVRAAAADALDHAPEDVRQAVADTLPGELSTDAALWEDAADGRLPDEPASLREAVAVHAAEAPLAELRRIIEFVREREQESAGPRRQEWRTLRGALHQAVALRGSRIALYDLRETVEGSAEPLPPSFLAAMHVVGDASCLEPLAAAFSRATPDERWRHQLAQTFRAVARREHITTRHSAMRRALARSPDLAS
jgi:hypothetical protein